MELETINTQANPQPLPTRVTTITHVVDEMNNQGEMIYAFKQSLARSLDGSTISAERQGQLENVFAVLMDNRMRLGAALNAPMPMDGATQATEYERTQGAHQGTLEPLVPASIHQQQENIGTQQEEHHIAEPIVEPAQIPAPGNLGSAPAGVTVVEGAK